MKLSIFTTLVLGSTAVLAMPKAEVESRQTTVIGTVTDTVNNLQNTLAANNLAIRNAVAAAQNNVGASAQIIAAVRANVPAIVTALTDAGNAISASTTGAVGGVAGAAQALTDAQRQQLADTIVTATRAVNALRATFRLAVTNLGPAGRALINSEVTAVNNAISVFTNPLQDFAQAVMDAEGSASVGVSGISQALADLVGIVNSLLSFIGL